MASVEKRMRDAGTTWLARWRDPDGAQRKRTFSRKSDAERYLTAVSAGLLDGSYVDPARSQLTVGVWAQQWLAAQVQLKESTRARYRGIIGKQVLPRWEHVPLAKVGHADVAGWVAQLSAEGLAPASVRKAHRVMSLILAGGPRRPAPPQPGRQGAPTASRPW